ncbi:MAG: FAD:protein FMN transferase [Acetobacterium sp.]
MNTRKMMIRISAVVLGLSLVMAMFTGCNSNKGKTVTRNDFLLDTFVSITLYGESDEALLDKPFEKIKELNNTLTAFEAGSDLTLIKENAGVKPVAVSEDTFQIIEKSIEYSKISGGYLDITTGPLIDLWGIEAPEIKEAPSPEAVAAARAKVDYTKIVLDADKKTVYLTDPGMSINVGAIAKGYIADDVMGMIKNEGVKHALVNLGGNVMLLGGKEDGSAFGVGVEDPRNPGEGYIGVLSLKDGSVVTSGDYQRYFTDAAGKRYHHILDPFTGYPSVSGLIQVTVIADKSIDADSLTTSLFLLGLDRGIALVNNTPGVEAIFINSDNKIFATKGLKDVFVFDQEKFGNSYTFTLME